MDSTRQQLMGGSRGKLSSNRACSRVKGMVSVYTCTLNALAGLERTIESVMRQRFTKIEYIIIDGASTDGTVEIIRRYSDQIAFWISEPDDGTADAGNKAIAQTSGEFVFNLPAGDTIPEDFLEIAMDRIMTSGADAVFGDQRILHPNGILEVVPGDPGYKDDFEYRQLDVTLGAILYRRKWFDRVGPYDTRYKVSMDREWFFRFHAFGGSAVYEPRLWMQYEGGGLSERQFYKGAWEARDALVAIGFSWWKSNWACLRVISWRFVTAILRRILTGPWYWTLKGRYGHATNMLRARHHV